MAQNQEAEVEIQNEKEEIVSCSPDSAINLSYEDEKSSGQSSLQSVKDSEKPSPPPAKRILQPCAQNTLYPFFYKYPDNRKLTLLKSLSQDSEYSLDTSLFDAEDFLQEMGFAGSCDPTIPDRFLPSLIQRLSKFPESEIESLNDRIVQSIGCFKRKEGKRRLFRNLSMGKDANADQSDISNLSISSSYPLLRSNTGPASFSFHEESSNNETPRTPGISKLSSSNSNYSSFGDDELFPESPIAILVSEASIDIDQDEKISQNVLEEEITCGEDSHDSHAPESMDSPENLTSQSNSKGDSVKDKFKEAACVGQSAAPELPDLDSSQSEQENISHLDVNSKELNDQVSSIIIEESEKSLNEVQTKTREEIYPLISIDQPSFENSNTRELTSPSSTIKPLPPKVTIKCSIVKHPLRRIPHATNFNNLRSSSNLGSLMHQTKVDFCDSPKQSSIESKSSQSFEKSYEVDDKNHNSTTIDSSAELSETSSSVSEREDLESLSDIAGQEFVSQTNDEKSTFEKSGNLIDAEVKLKYPKVSKPKYVRDDSLTNFLSSMLDTNDESLSPNSSITSQSFSFEYTAIENLDKKAEIPSFNPFIQKEDSKLTPSEVHLNENSQGMNKESKLLNRQVKEKTSNRKRRMLRRMSSSLNYGDEEISIRPALPVDIQDNSSKEYFPSNFMQPKISLRSTLSAPQFANCPVMYPCCCVPAVNICSCHRPYRGNIQDKCDNFICTPQCDNIEHKTVEKVQSFPTNRKIKRSCNRNRYLSCPSSMADFGCNTCYHPRPLSRSIQNLHKVSHSHLCRHNYPSPPRCFTSQQTSWSQDYSELETKTISNCNGGYLSDPQNSANVSMKSHNSSYKHPPQIFNPLQPECAFSFKSKVNSTNQLQWNSTPDVRHEYTTFPSRSTDLYSQRRDRINGDYFNKHTSGFRSHTSISRESYFHDDVFLPDPNTRSFSYLQEHSDNFNLNKHDNLQDHSSQRKNNISRENFKKHSVGLHSSNTRSSALQNKESNLVEKYENLPPTSHHLGREIDSNRNLPLKASNSYPLQKKDMSSNDINSVQENRRMSYVDESNILAPDPKDEIHSQNNKREPLQEKKIRVFSTFLTNLSKSVQSDTKFDCDHKSTRESRYDDFALADKNSESHLRNNKPDSKQINFSNKCRTSSPELDKLLKMLNSMDLNKSSGGCDQTIPQSSCDVDVIKNVSDNTAPVYENSVFLKVKDSDQHLFTPVSYTSSISMHISDYENNGLHRNRPEKEIIHPSSTEESSSAFKKNISFRRCSLEMPFKGVSKELEELQLSIQKAKEMRISASRELHLLQELLSRDTCEDHESIKKEKTSSISSSSCQTENVYSDVEKAKLEALADLREKSASGDSDEAAFWKEEIKKMKKENDEAWRAKLDRMEERLISQEEELRKVHSENDILQKQLELQTTASPTCHCRPDVVQNGFGRIDSAFEDDEEYINHKSSIPIQSSRQECERLQEQLIEAEQRADQLNLLLNQKLIELNKLQLTLSKQTKEMIELEKSYLQLQYRLRKGTSKPMVAKLCSRTSPFNSKNLCPKPSPPASPHPNGVS